MSKNNGNSIRPREHGSQVILDPNFLLRHALYMPDGATYREIEYDSWSGNRSDRTGACQGQDASTPVNARWQRSNLLRANLL